MEYTARSRTTLHWLDDLDETVHIILMEDPKISLGDCLKKAREIHQGLTITDFMHAWIPYRGMDGRIHPTKKI